MVLYCRASFLEWRARKARSPAIKFPFALAARRWIPSFLPHVLTSPLLIYPRSSAVEEEVLRGRERGRPGMSKYEFSI